MAQTKRNKKGFWLIECTEEEICNIGGGGICDNCGQPSDKGVYVAVLNRWLCPKCFDEWYNTAIRYEEDSNIEFRNYQYYATLLGI